MSTTSISFAPRHLFNNLVALFSNSTLSQGMTALALLLTARQLGAAAFGQYAACFALSGILSIGFNLGLDSWLLREGGRIHDRFPEFLGSALSVKLVGGIFWVGLMALLGILLNNQAYPPLLLTLSAVSVWLDGIFLTALSAFKSKLQNKFTLLLESTSDLVWLIATVVLILLRSVSPTDFVLIRIAILLLSAAAGIWLVYRRFSLGASVATARQSIHAAVPFAISDFLAHAAMRIDVSIVSFTIGEFYTGLYSPAVSITNALFLIPGAIYILMVPMLSNLFSTQPKRAWRVFNRLTVALIGIGFALTASLYLSSGLISQLLGKSFSQSAGILRILSFILIFKSGSFAMAAALVSTGLQKQRASWQAFSVLLNATLNLLVVRKFGIQGVAVVYLVTEAALFVGYTWLVFLHRKQNPILQEG